MKEKIYKYLLEKHETITPEQILEKFFYTFDKPIPQAEKIVDSILSDDVRFVKEESGFWSVKKQEKKQSLHDIVFSIIEYKTIPINNKKELPVLLAIAQVKNFKPVSKKIFTIDIPIKISNEIQNKRETLISQTEIDGKFLTNLDTIYESLTGSVLVSDSPCKTMDRLNWFFRQNGKFELEIEKINLKDLSRKLIPGHKNKTVEDIADGLNISYHSPLNFSERTDLFIDIWIELLDKLKKINIESIEDLNIFLTDTFEWVNFSNYNFDEQFIKDLPSSPGVYLMKNKEGEVFYVGKAKNLKSRVESYFANRYDVDEKGKKVLSDIYDLQIETTGSELEALLLENKYINQYQPELNRQFKIHHLKEQKYLERRVIAFLPSQMLNTITLFLVNGIKSAIRYSFNKDKPDIIVLKNTVQQFFFKNSKNENSFSSEQIEIIWRWLYLNKNKVNFFNVDDCGTLDKCLEITRRYISENKLFLEKIHHC